MRRAMRLLGSLGDGGRSRARRALSYACLGPVLAWLGLGLIGAGLLVMPIPPPLPLALALGGLGLATLAAAMGGGTWARSAKPAVDLEHRVEALKDGVWELRESEARYRDLLDTQAHMIARRERDGRLTYVNRAFCRMLGVEPSDVLGTSWRAVVLAEERAAESGGGQFQRRNYVQLVETKIGPRWLAFEEHAVPGQRVDAADGDKSQCGEIQIVGSDITEARAAEALLADARDQAQAADRAKSRFLASMSHEIRTPMNGIMGMAGLLSETQLSAEQRTYLDAIDQSARTLLLLIDEILDFSKIEAGRLALAVEPLSIDACVQGVVELMAPAAHEKGLEIAWTIDPALPLRLIGDAARVRQIMLNLIGNAVKFTDRGGILVNLACAGAEDGVARVTVRVKDTGIGLSSDAIARLFGEFSQADSEAARHRGGTGLGLAISRRLARAMGGDITVESQPGRGATFTVTLSLRVDTAAVADASPHVVPASQRGNGVLLAFDRLIERRALSSNLAAIGLVGVDADDPLEGGEIEAAAACGKSIRFVVCDAQADPKEAAAVLAKAQAHVPDGQVRGLLLIDSVTRPSLEQFRAAGFTSYLVRPVRPQMLVARFAPAVSGGICDELAGASLVEEERERLPCSGRHVLLAEDNAVNALLATRMLEKAGCSVVHAGDGEEALAALAAAMHGGARAFDLILMDVHMPRLDGLEAVARMRALGGTNEAWRNLPPVVALTANAFDEDRERCLAGGFDDYLSKPFHKSDLIGLIERCRHRTDPRAA